MKWKHTDFDKSPELSPDLEWMLQSGQVSRQVFTETLVKTYYASIYRLALSLLNDLSAAQLACREVFSHAILGIHQYRSRVGVEVWINQIAYRVIKTAMRRERFWRGVEKLMGGRGQFTDKLGDQPQTKADRLIWQQVDQMDDTERISFVLYFANGWQLEQIAATLELTPEKVRESLERNLSGFAHLDQDLPPDLEAWVRKSLQRRWSAPEMGDEDLDHFSLKIQRHTGQRGILRNGAATTHEIVLLGVALVIVILAIWGGNRYFLHAENDFSSPGSYLDMGGLGVIQERVGSSMTLAGSGQALSENGSELAKDEEISAQFNRANDRSLQSRSERCQSADLRDVSLGRYAAFKNKDRIRRFSLSQPIQSATVPPTEIPTDSSLIPSYLEPIEARGSTQKVLGSQR